MSRSLFILGFLGVALGVTACQGERSERVAASYSSATTRNARPLPTSRPQKSALASDTLPVEEDYEARAGSSITEANLEAKLAEVERELRP